MRRLFSACGLVVMLCAAAAAQPPVSEIRRESRHIDRAGAVERVNIALFNSRGPLRSKAIPHQPGATSLRLRFSINSAPDAPNWTLRVRDGSGNVAWTFTPAQGGASDVWSDEIVGSVATVEIALSAPNDPARPLKLAVDRIARGSAPTRAESITDPNNLTLVAFESAATRAVSRAVGRLRFVGDDDKLYLCTGFLVSRSLFLTNNHCISSDTEMRSGLVDFDFDNPAPGPTAGGARFSRRVAFDPTLDFALLRLEQSTPAAMGCLPLDPTVPPARRGLMIFQHPNGEAKQLSFLGCEVDRPLVVGLTPQVTDFSHLCDTDGGSSGSPVIDRTLRRVVGLHHLGFDTENSVSDFKTVNRAVHIGPIIESIRTQDSAAASEIASPCV